MDTAKTVDTPYNNAVSVISRTNELLVENNVKESDGKTTAQLEMTAANPAWLFALACGSLHTSWQQQLAKAYSALDPQNCEDDQVLVLAALAGIERENGTPSHITVEITNKSDEAVTVPYRTEFTENTTLHSWYINKDITIAAKMSQVAILYTEENGAFTVSADTNFTCADDALDVSAVSLSDSYEGEDIETIASLRNRISTNTESLDFLSKTERQIEALGGVESCSIWFNQSVAAAMTVGGVQIPPRNAYISIKGADINNGIAERYYRFMNAPATVGSHVSEYVIANQTVEVHYDVAEEVEVEIFVRIRAADAAVGAVEYILQTLTKWSGSLKAGEDLTAQMVSQWLANFAYALVMGCYVDTENGYSTSIKPNQYCVWSKDTITVEGV